ncbi:Ig-like domain repeat protein [Nocardioides alcanivorans]|uniref:Ig-like domain repeat protein n=1 Tax=Nocardioides alcanivorans TaxID=2897352 RepID=UPI001F2FCCF3|nr:Ig-like domain repeat protein [Nocardioides alcanivorans]
MTFAAQATETGVDLTAELEDMPNTAPPFVSLPGQEFVATLGTDLGDLTGTRTGDFQGGTPVAIPVMSGSVAGSGDSLAIAVEEFDLAVGSSASIPCTLEAPVEFEVPVTELPVEPIVKDLALNCTFSGNDFAYDTDVQFSAQATNGGSVQLSADLEDMPNTAPPFVSLPGQEFVATLGTDLGDLTGTRTGDFQGGTPVAIPTMTGAVAGAGDTLAVSVEEFTLAVGSAATIPCTLATPAEFNVPVTAAPQPPAPKAVKTSSKATAKYAKKAKKATIKIKVKAASGTPNGKVKIVVKAGKKKVVAKNVKVNKKGVAKLVLKKAKLKKKGKYKVNAVYQGNKQFKKSKTNVNFKVK